MKTQFLAHIQSDENRIQTVEEHLHNTAVMAAAFGAVFGAGASAYNAGLLHDIGKCSDEFQKRIRGENIRTDHSTFGAQTAVKMKLLHEAFAIAGHHSGIPDFGTRLDGDMDSTLSGRLKRNVPDASSFRKEINTDEIRQSKTKFHSTLEEEFYIRMLYSCLVDADYLDTEAFMNGKAREYEFDSIDILYDRLKEYVSEWQHPDSELNQIRQEVQKECFEKGKSFEKGIYTLTVPTGGGKTISSLAFALSMAKEKRMNRIIYVIPYTSIIDQTAEVFSEILGESNVLEHHSGVKYQFNETDDLGEDEYRKLLVSENWDCPVIVTTSVQFFESLFSNRPSSCRKLHNIASSVIVFDEAQNLPFYYLKPCVHAISQLVKNYGCTALLCTATQPVLNKIISESDFLGNNYSVREINDSPERMYQALKRNTVIYLGKTDMNDIVARMCSVNQSLCVVNTRSAAQELYNKLPEASSNYCLTTLICPKHRKKMIFEIKEKLKNGETCRVVSTSLIEAGIDLDFKMAFREITGLDSVIQTAGRCNREGRNNVDNSNVSVFEFSDREIPSTLKRNADACRTVMKHHDDPSSLAAIEEYFRLYQTISGEDEMDRKQILRKLKEGVDGRMYPFASIADEFHLIETDMVSIYVPLGEGENVIEKMKEGKISKTLMRTANQYCVNVHPQQYEKLLRAGAVCQIDHHLSILTDMRYYSENTGLTMGVETGIGVFI